MTKSEHQQIFDHFSKEIKLSDATRTSVGADSSPVTRENVNHQESLTLKTGAFPFSDHLLIASSTKRKTVHGLLYSLLTYQLPLVSFPYLSYSESKIQCLSHSHSDRKKPYDPLPFNNSLVNIAILDESNFLPSLTLHLVLGTARVKLHNQKDWYCPNS